MHAYMVVYRVCTSSWYYMYILYVYFLLLKEFCFFSYRLLIWLITAKCMHLYSSLCSGGHNLYGSISCIINVCRLSLCCQIWELVPDFLECWLLSILVDQNRHPHRKKKPASNDIDAQTSRR